jgi:hypothetical protein
MSDAGLRELERLYRAESTRHNLVRLRLAEHRSQEQCGDCGGRPHDTDNCPHYVGRPNHDCADQWCPNCWRSGLRSPIEKIQCAAYAGCAECRAVFGNGPHKWLPLSESPLESILGVDTFSLENWLAGLEHFDHRGPAVATLRAADFLVDTGRQPARSAIRALTEARASLDAIRSWILSPDRAMTMRLMNDGGEPEPFQRALEACHAVATGNHRRISYCVEVAQLAIEARNEGMIRDAMKQAVQAWALGEKS